MAQPMVQPARSIVQLQNVGKTFYRGKEPIVILDGLNLEVPEGAFEALMGPSGSGKSTLLNLIAGLDRPTSGHAVVAGAKLTDDQYAAYKAGNLYVNVHSAANKGGEVRGQIKP